MNFSAGPVLLLSLDKTRMFDFLSDVFEFEVDTQIDLVKNGLFPFKIIQNEMSISDHNQNVSFQFQCESLHHLKDILQKFEFFMYRKTDSLINEKVLICDFNESQNSGFLSIRDIDGRCWNFTTEKLQ
jgi:hypothetical protein